MKTLCCVLFVVAVCFCVVGFMGHIAAWPAAALSFFAATAMIIVRQRKHNDDKK